MSLLHKLQVRISPKQFFYHLRAKQPTEHLLASIDEGAFRALLKYKDDTGHPQYKKYFNAAYWLRLNIQRALYLKLNQAETKSILDIGAGFGYFPYVAKFYGHDVLGIDLPGDVLFNKAATFLNIKRQEYTIERNVAMPSFEQKFDLVTAFQVCFNGHIEGEIWGVKEWDFFLKDLFANHMNDGGKVYFEMNYSPHIDGWLPREVADMFRDQYRAQFDGPSRITLFAPKG